jgi:RNase P subunit RPR2
VRAPGILVIDIESAPLEAYVWGLWDQNIGVDFIKEEWSILSYAAKWLGEKKIYYGDTGGRGEKKVRDDKRLVGEIRDLLDSSDIVVAQNGKRFDIRKINARLIKHGYLPPAPYKVIDTLVVAKKYFAFTSQKLAWTSKHLTDEPKEEHREFPGFELWKECLRDNPRAWAVMKRYNCRDITSTEKVYLKMRPWIESHPNLSIYSGGEKPACPKCDSKHVQARGRAVLQAGIYTRYQCQECGGWSRGRVMVNGRKERQAKLA